MSPPLCVILGGANGSGKTTVAASLLRDGFGIRPYVNADVLAQGLSGFSVEEIAFAASKLMLERIGQMVELSESFAFETTLSGRSLAKSIQEWNQAGYRVCLVYLWLRTPI
jgi:predicted ABC-type ATPase